jgi:hypothetical protein
VIQVFMARPVVTPPRFPEAAPDVEVFLEITGSSQTDCETRVACINISKTTADLKMSLSNCLKLDLDNLQIWKGNIELQDRVPLVDYEISHNDTLEIRVINR